MTANNMEGAATTDSEVLQLIQSTEGLTLKPAVAATDKNNVKKEVNLTNFCLNNSKIDLLEIVVLDLSNCDLTCVPEGLGELKNLRVLNLAHNKLLEAPECLNKNLRFLEHLDLSYNQIRDFEREPACHVRLKVLLLNDNDLLNIPEWILYVRCFNLEEFDYSFNEVNRLCASQFTIKSNYRLKKLGLQSCFIFERDFEYLNGIKTLQYLDLSNSRVKRSTNVIKGEKLFEKPLFAQTLQVLKLNYLTLSILSENIACLANLRELYLMCNNLSWLPGTLSTLRHLEVLDVSENTICCLPKDFGNLCNLKKLIAHCNSLSNLPDLSKMPQLSYLDLYQNLLTDFPFNTASFTHLDLEQNYLKTGELPQYEDYLKKRQNLRSTTNFSCRTDSPYCLIVPDRTSSSCSSPSFTDLENPEEEEEELIRITEEYVEESWDRPSVSSNYVRVCTESDDEWTGPEPPLLTTNKKYNWNVNVIKQRVSPVFSDAD